MKRVLLLVLCALLAPWTPPVTAGPSPLLPPTILSFTCDLPAVTVAALEAGGVTAKLSWTVANSGEEYRLELEVYQVNHWKSLPGTGEQLLMADSRMITVEHPLNFGPPTYRLSLLNRAGEVLDERTLTIPYAVEHGVLPTIDWFTLETQDVEVSDLAAGNIRIPVAWRVSHRQPMTQLVFEQFLPDETVISVELPRDSMWVPSTGSGVIAPVLPSNGSDLQLRLRVINVIDGALDDIEVVFLPIAGLPTATPTPTLVPMPPSPTGPPSIPLTPTAMPVPPSPVAPPTATLAPAVSPTPAEAAVDVCSEDTYYAEAIVAMKWLETHPPAQPLAGDAYGHSQLDGLYRQLLAEGKVQPPPPPCTLTARTLQYLWSGPGNNYLQIGTMQAGETAEVQGRDEEARWWYVNFASGGVWGWVDSSMGDLQPGTSVAAIPVRG